MGRPKKAQMWRDRGMKDFLAGKSIDNYYNWGSRESRGERNRVLYEIGWRGTKADQLSEQKEAKRREALNDNN